MHPPKAGRAVDRRHGIATGLAFDYPRHLYVGADRSGDGFQISPSARFLFSPRWSIQSRRITWRAFPVAIWYVSRPDDSSFDRIHRITQGGEVSVFFAGWDGRRDHFGSDGKSF